MTEEQTIAVEPRHIGDGVYVSFDGWQIWLAANDHRNKVVALEPSVLRALVDYARGIDEAYERDHFGIGR